MDVSKINIEYVDEFDSYYLLACGVLNANRENSSAKMQKKIRKRIYKHFLSKEKYPKNVEKFFSSDVNDSDFIDFFKSCSEYISKNGNAVKQRFDKASEALPAEIKDALWALISLEPTLTVDKNAHKISAILENNNACRRTLTLHGASCPDELYDLLSFASGSLAFSDGVYKLAATAVNYDNETEVPFIIEFTNATVDIEIFNATQTSFSNDPWTHLIIVASSITDKHLLPGDYFNEKEKEILPLLFELGRLSFFASVPDEYKHKKFELLPEYCKNHGGEKLIPLFDTLSEKYNEPKLRSNIQTKLITALNGKKFESLWRSLYNIVCLSQSSYLSSAETFCPKERKEFVKIAEELMKKQGYSGTYPDFYKRGRIKGVHLSNSYENSYFIANEKKVDFYVHCDEDVYDNTFSAQILCGTAILRKNEESEDVYSCTFNANGKRLFKTVTYTHGCDLSEDYTADRALEIAIKKSELKKLSKVEKNSPFHQKSASIAEFLSIFIIMGGMFAIATTIAMALLSIAVTALFGLASEIPNMLSQMPWGLILAISWIGFGGGMGIVTLMSKNK